MRRALMTTAAMAVLTSLMDCDAENEIACEI